MKSWLGTRLKIFAAIFSAAVVVEPTAFAKRDYRPHSGYLETTEKERDLKYRDLVLIKPPPPSRSVSLNEQIFNQTLTREFRDRYEQLFGRTEAERVYKSPNRFTYNYNLYGFRGTLLDEDAEMRRYGDFVVRRLMEYHLDSYAQSSPKLRPAWEAKERIKEFKVEVAQFRFDAQYSIAGNTVDLRLANPFLSLLRVRLQMDPARLGPGPVDEAIFSMGRALTSRTFAEVHYSVVDGIVSLIQRKTFTEKFGGTLSESTYLKGGGHSARESKYLAGLSYVF